jgi:hypothetical protein
MMTIPGSCGPEPSLRAKRSNPWGNKKARVDCFAALAMTVRYSFAFSPRDAPEFCSNVPPSSYGGEQGYPQEGSRECRAPDAPAALRAKVESTQASHHGHAGSPGIPRAVVLTAYFALSPVTGLSCHRRPRNDSVNLTPASGRQDHTTSPSARKARSSMRHLRPPHPAPRS